MQEYEVCYFLAGVVTRWPLFVDPCDSAPCLNGGTCISLPSVCGSSNDTCCNCTSLFDGQHCEKREENIS